MFPPINSDIFITAIFASPAAKSFYAGSMAAVLWGS
jgi:hypothetical protein